MSAEITALYREHNTEYSKHVRLNLPPELSSTKRVNLTSIQVDVRRQCAVDATI